jgi:hypothetical protein
MSLKLTEKNGYKKQKVTQICGNKHKRIIQQPKRHLYKQRNTAEINA